MPAWYLNPGLVVLVTALRLMFPGVVIYDIGDPDHQSRKSDHNPNSAGRVNAIDIMLRGPFTKTIAKWLIGWLIKDRRVKYLIFDERIWENGEWDDYGGDNPHKDHIHLSCWDNARLNTKPWKLEEDEVTPAELLAFDGIDNRFSDREKNPKITVETALENASRASVAEAHALDAAEGVRQLLARPVAPAANVVLSDAQLDSLAERILVKLSGGVELAFRKATP